MGGNVVLEASSLQTSRGRRYVREEVLITHGFFEESARDLALVLTCPRCISGLEPLVTTPTRHVGHCSPCRYDVELRVGYIVPEQIFTVPHTKEVRRRRYHERDTLTRVYGFVFRRKGTDRELVVDTGILREVRGPIKLNHYT